MNRTEENYESFAEMITQQIKKRTVGKATVSRTVVQKANLGRVPMLLIRPLKGNVASAIQLRPLYDQYTQGISLAKIADEIMTSYGNTRINGKVDISSFYDFEKVRKNIYCKILGTETNKELLASIPHRRYLDMALAYYYEPDQDDRLAAATILITNDHIRMWGITEEQLYLIAANNTRRNRPGYLTTIDQILRTSTDSQGIDEDKDDDNTQKTPLQMYILINRQMRFGAVAIAFADTLAMIAADLKDDYYVLPSSVHECVILPAASITDFGGEGLRNIVQEINNRYVSPDEVLTSTVYRYYRETGQLRIIAG